MMKILYIIRGWLICNNFYGNLYSTYWFDNNPSDTDLLHCHWIKYHWLDEYNTPHSFISTSIVGNRIIKEFSYEYVGKYFVIES